MRNQMRIAAVTMAMAAGMVVSGARPVCAQAGGPAFNEYVLEMTPTTMERFGAALNAADEARKAIAAKAAVKPAKARLTPQQYQQCMANLAMSPGYMQLIQDLSEAASNATDPAAQQKMAETMGAKMQAFVEKECGVDPSATPPQVDVAGEVRRAEDQAAKANGFTPRQYEILKERIAPLCLSDALAAGGPVRLPGDGHVFFVYTASEVQAVRPHCPAFTKLLYPKAR